MGVLPSRWKGTLGTPGSRTLEAWELNSLVGRVIVLQPANCGLWSLGFLRVLVGPERDVGGEQIFHRSLISLWTSFIPFFFYFILL